MKHQLVERARRVVVELLQYRDAKHLSRSLKYGEVGHYTRRQRLCFTRKLTNTADNGAEVDGFVERHNTILELVEKLLERAASDGDAPCGFSG